MQYEHKHKSKLTPGERELADALSTLSPLKVDAGRDEMMFRAGRVSAQRRSRSWQTLSVVMVACFAISLFWPRQMIMVVEETVESHPTMMQVWPDEAGEDPPVKMDLDENSYLKVRLAVAEHGLDALPDSPGWVASQPMRVFGYGRPVRRDISSSPLFGSNLITNILTWGVKG